MFGSHLSIAGGLQNALIDAGRLGMDCVQVFTANQRQWKTKDISDEQVRVWRGERERTGIGEVVSHDSYLVNLASPTGENRDKSIALFRRELERCEALGIPSVVAHPGAHLGDGDEKGIKRIAKALDRVHKDLRGFSVVTCLESTAGQGTTIGWRFEHLRRIIDTVKDPSRLGVCLDTAHLIEAGYDLTGAAGCRAVLREFDDVVGLGLVRVWHLNDSKTAMGSRVDRHEHIGHGHVSLGAFEVIVNHPKFKKVPKILETAKEDSPDGTPWDVINLRVLRGLVRGQGGGAGKKTSTSRVKRRDAKR